MTVVINIDGTDRTNKVDLGTLRIKRSATRRRNVCLFNITTHQNRTYVPSLGQEVTITDTGDKVYGGIITAIESKANAYSIVEHEIECQGYERLLDKKLVPDTFENQTVEDIIFSIQSNYFPSSITTNNVECPVIVNFAAFNYKPISLVLEELAEISGYDWYIDSDRDLHFFKAEDNNAPFDIQDNDGSYYYNSLIIRKDNSQVRNRITVRGGLYDGESFTSIIEANGQDFIFPLPYRYSNFAATLTGNPLNVGVDYLNQADDYDALYNYNEKIIRFKEADTPSASAILRVSGNPKLPVIVTMESGPDIATLSAQEGSVSDGVYEFLINDPRIETKAGARERALGEMMVYANTVTEAEFVTEKLGLEVGMRIRVNSTSRNIDDYYIINKINTTIRTKDQLQHQVSLVSTKTLDFIDLLKRFELRDRKDIVIDENETVDLSQSFTDSVTISETLTAQPFSYQIKFVLGDNRAKNAEEHQFVLGGSELQS